MCLSTGKSSKYEIILPHIDVISKKVSVRAQFISQFLNKIILTKNLGNWKNRKLNVLEIILINMASEQQFN